MRLAILFPDQHNCTWPGTIRWPYSSNINHFLEVLPDLLIQPWWHSPIMFFNGPGPLLQGDLMFDNGVSSWVKVIIGKDIFNCLQNPLDFSLVLGSHSANPKRSTFPRTSGSRVGTSDPDWGGLGVCWITYFSDWSGLIVWPTSDSSSHSFGGRSTSVWPSTSLSGTFSAVYTLPMPVLEGVQTSWTDKFLNTIPTHFEPGQRSP